MSILFQPASIKKLQLRNRFIWSAAYDGMAHTSGHVSAGQIKLISKPALIREWGKDPQKTPRCIYCYRYMEELHQGIPLHGVAFLKNKECH